MLERRHGMTEDGASWRRGGGLGGGPPLRAWCTECYRLGSRMPVVGARHRQVQCLDVVEDVQLPPAFSRDSISSISRSNDKFNRSLISRSSCGWPVACSIDPDEPAHPAHGQVRRRYLPWKIDVVNRPRNEAEQDGRPTTAARARLSLQNP